MGQLVRQLSKPGEYWSYLPHTSRYYVKLDSILSAMVDSMINGRTHARDLIHQVGRTACVVPNLECTDVLVPRVGGISIYVGKFASERRCFGTVAFEADLKGPRIILQTILSHSRTRFQ
jgi:hypothetical protein